MYCIQEWLPSLPLHLDIYASLKLPPPTFGHMPILLNADGSKMSKRHGDVQVVDFIVSHELFDIQYAKSYNHFYFFQKRGWEPEAVLNWVVLSGWGVSHDTTVVTETAQGRVSAFVPDSTQIMSLDEMIDRVRLSSYPLSCFNSGLLNESISSSIFLPSLIETLSWKLQNWNTLINTI